MFSFDSLDAFLFSASSACCSPLAIFVQIQGFFICLILALGWALASFVRGKEIRRLKEGMRCGNSFAFLCYNISDLEHCNQVKLPRVTVVMPLKGFGEHNLHNWRTQITSLYGGPLEFLFVVESTEDPAYHAVTRLLADFKDDVDAKIVVAGLSTTCSQKIHNHEFICPTCDNEGCIEDTIAYIRSTGEAIASRTCLRSTNNMEIVCWKLALSISLLLVDRGQVREAIASAVDLVQAMVSSIQPSLSQVGHMNPPVSELSNIGVEKMHKDSKYVLFLDDDVRLHPGSIGALTAEMEKNPDIFIQTGYPLDLPSGSLGSYCIYEYHMPCSMGFATGGKTFFLWGGCMMMHANDFRNDNHGVVSELQNGGYSDDMTLAAIAGAHKRLITSPPVAVFPHPLASDLNFSRYWNYLRKQTFVLESYTTKINWIMNRALFSTHCYLSWGFVMPYIMSAIHVAAALRFYSKGYSLGEAAFPCNGLSFVGCHATCTIIELLSMWNLTRIEVLLCNLLSPEAPPLSLASYNWCLVFIAMLVDNFLYPLSAIRSHFSQSIDWSGIRYHLKDGKINKIERSKGKGPKFTDLGGKHLYGKKGAPNNYSFLRSLSKSFVQWRQPKKYDL